MTTYQVHITRRAERDLARAQDYIEFSLKNPQAADGLLMKRSVSFPAWNKCQSVLPLWMIIFWPLGESALSKSKNIWLSMS